VAARTVTKARGARSVAARTVTKARGGQEAWLPALLQRPGEARSVAARTVTKARGQEVCSARTVTKAGGYLVLRNASDILEPPQRVSLASC
jgi:hypothetical protein